MVVQVGKRSAAVVLGRLWSRGLKRRRSVVRDHLFQTIDAFDDVDDVEARHGAEVVEETAKVNVLFRRLSHSSEWSCETWDGDQRWGGPDLKAVLGGREGHEGLGVVTSLSAIELFEGKSSQKLVDDAIRSHGGQVPVENLQHQQFPLLQKDERKLN